MSEAKTVETKAAQRAQSKRATFAALTGKKPKQAEFTVDLGDEQVTLLFRAIGATEYDKLLTLYPPTKEQLAEGASFDINRFGPALLAKVCIEPAVDVNEWRDLWTSEKWNRGEVLEMFTNAVNLCNQGLDLTPTVAG